MKIKQIAIALDQLINTFCGGYADESLSTRCWRLRAFKPYCWLRPCIDTLLWFSPNHCQSSYDNRMSYVPKDPP